MHKRSVSFGEESKKIVHSSSSSDVVVCKRNDSPQQEEKSRSFSPRAIRTLFINKFNKTDEKKPDEKKPVRVRSDNFQHIYDEYGRKLSNNHYEMFECALNNDVDGLKKL